MTIVANDSLNVMLTQVFQHMAQKVVLSTQNSSWKNRGEMFVQKPLRIVKIEQGHVFLAHILFEKPSEDSRWHLTTPFNGFVMGLLSVDEVNAVETLPVIGEIKDEIYEQVANKFLQRFCCKCNAFDSIKQTNKRSGPECIIITYKCTKCKHKEVDVMD